MRLAMKPVVTLSLIALSITILLLYLFVFGVKYESRTRIPVDANRVLVQTKSNPIIGDSKAYIALMDLNKGMLWKHKLDKDFFSINATMYEQRYRRDVMVKDGAISILLDRDENPQDLYKFDLQRGKLISRLDLPSLHGYYGFWSSLQDTENLYCLSGSMDDLVLNAISFDSFEIIWSSLLPDNGESIHSYHAPYQNENWIVLHKSDYVPEPQKIYLIDKKTGEARLFPVDSPGVLKGDAYYYPSYRQDNREYKSADLIKIDLKSGESETLYEMSPPPQPFSDDRGYSISNIWLYRDRLIAIHNIQGTATLICRNLESGSVLWRTPLPNFLIDFDREMWHSKDRMAAPEFSGLPHIDVPYLLLPLEDKSEVESDVPPVKYVLVNLEEGTIRHESQGIPQRFILNYYQNSYYHLALPVPDSPTNAHDLLSIDAQTGDISCIRPGHLYNKDQKSYFYLHEYNEISLRQGLAPMLLLGDNALIDLKKMEIQGHGRNQYFIDGITDEIGELYGF
ncbi:MAG: hypothetical protein PQJ58_14320 [Spirochaetales bacterium]|nr:hypothetical protein [Spirochaetales bacterium]